MLKRWAPIWAAVLLCGCFQVQDELTVEPDGSGTIKLTVRSSLPEDMLNMLGPRLGAGQQPIYPPSSQAEARRFFPAKNFTVQVEEKKADGGKTVVITAGFKDINTLLASPYGHAHQLAVKVENGALRLRALNGGETLAYAAQFKPEGDLASFQMPGMEEAAKKKGEMCFEFRVTLPNAVTEGNGARTNKTAIWTAERAKCKDDDEFANSLSGPLEAACPAEGIKFAPVTPPRLGLTPFAQLAAGKAAGGTALLDTNKINAAARFVPYALEVTRTLDLSGEGASRDSRAQLIGALSLPRELAPQRWGEAKLQEAIDPRGTNLVPKANEGGMSGMRVNRFGMNEESEGDDQEGEGKAGKDNGQVQKILTLSFKAPEWKVREIAKVKGTMELQYPGSPEVIKLSNAVPADLVIDMSKRPSSQPDPERGLVNDPRLAELGLRVRVQMARVQSSITSLSLETRGSKAMLLDAQVFDADGRPWASTFIPGNSPGEEDRSCQILVAGKPKPPFSLALLVSGQGASVEVPILVEKIPILVEQPAAEGK